MAGGLGAGDRRAKRKSLGRLFSASSPLVSSCASWCLVCVMTERTHTEASDVPTAADLRAQVARCRALLYLIAPKVGLHPTRLGQLLNERVALTPELARRIREALRNDG
jgi:hypothetical protein